MMDSKVLMSSGESSPEVTDAIPVRVSRLGKRFRLRHERERSLKSTLLSLFKSRSRGEDFWALRNISFDVERGETLGMIGANGAGKSTLLGLLAQTMKPTEGAVEIHGRVSSLLELGAGFHPELTGRENVFLNGSILGLSRGQIEERYERIVQFAELEPFMDVPVKHYSSGMYVRLGFSVAVEVDPDILLIDEVLAVGDGTFRKKCLQKIADFQKAGKTLLIVSHDLEVVKKISDRVLLLDHGQFIELGRPQEVVDEYVRLGLEKGEEPLMRKDWGNFEAQIEKVLFRNSSGGATDRFQSLSPMEVEIFYNAKKRINRPVFGFSIADQEGKICFGTNTQIKNLSIPWIEGRGQVTLQMVSLPFIRGKYFFSFSIHSEDHKVSYHRQDHAYAIWIESQRQESGFVDIETQWEIQEGSKFKV
ncbi:MAG: ABC transporter ATP-binding protein [Chlamydiae bacterium]|nr:ABC transporter ATP-binding protein [Chlamydiota bacterium]MBI3277215.1 ABC transporter ATP-binding protein [Chlamydiota bacterium]